MGSCLNQTSATTAAATATADWSELPNELLILISKRLDNEFDLIRFRSVCSSWRSSSIPPFDFISCINKIDSASFCYLSKHTIFLIKPKQQDQTLVHRPWLIRITKNSNGKTKLFHPLLHQNYHFPNLLDFNEFSAIHLKTEFIMDEDFTFDIQPYNRHRHFIYPKKVVAVVCRGKQQPMVLGMSSRLLLLKCGNEKKNWKVIHEISVYFGDICLFKRRPYAVDKTGRTIMVGPDTGRVELMAEPLVGGGGGYRKYLVENEGDLLLVDVYECLCLGFPGHDPVRIDLFKLNENEKKWVKLTSLGDRVLFLGLVCSFSASASDLCVAKGNCVIFLDNIFRFSECASCVLDLDEGRLSPMSDYPGYSSLFCEPPEWIVKS